MAASSRNDDDASSQLDPHDRMDYAFALRRAGKNAAALEEYLWCFDHGNEHDPAFSGVRVSFLLGYINDLGQSYPPAIAAVEQRRDAAEQLTLSDEGDFHSAQDVVALNRELGTPERTLAVFDRLGEGGEKQKDTRHAMLSPILEILIENKRYESVLEAAGDIGSRVDQLIEAHDRLAQHVQRNEDLHFVPDKVISSHRRNSIEKIGNFYEALLGANETAAAEAVADKLLNAFRTEPDTYVVLSQHCMRVGRKAQGKAFLEKGLRAVSDEDQRIIQKALLDLNKDGQA